MATAVQEENKAIVQRWIDEVFNTGRLSSVDELKVSSYLDWTPLPSPYQQIDLPVSGIKDALPEWLSALPDFHFTSDRMTAESDFVVCLGHWGAHHRGTYKGMAPTNKRLGGTRIDIFRVAGDKMVEHWGCGNELAFLQLIGALDSTANGATPAEEIARSFVARALGNRDMAAVADLLDSDAVDRSGQSIALLGLVAGFPDLEIVPTEVAVDGDTIVVASTVSGTHAGTFLGIPATGKEVSAVRIDRIRVADGKIVECRSEGVESAFLRALGEPPAARANGHGPEAPKDAVRRFLDTVLNGKDFAAAPSFFAADAIDHFRGSLTAYLTFAACPDLQLSTEHVIAEDDLVTVLATFTGTQEGPALGLAPTHKGVTGRVAFSFRVDEEGRFAETWTEIEPWTLLQQLSAQALA